MKISYIVVIFCIFMHYNVSFGTQKRKNTTSTDLPPKKRKTMHKYPTSLFKDPTKKNLVTSINLSLLTQKTLPYTCLTNTKPVHQTKELLIKPNKQCSIIVGPVDTIKVGPTNPIKVEKVKSISTLNKEKIVCTITRSFDNQNQLHQSNLKYIIDEFYNPAQITVAKKDFDDWLHNLK